MVDNIKDNFSVLRENYSPVSVINFYSSLKNIPTEEIMENSQFIFVEPDRGPQFLKGRISETYPNVSLESLQSVSNKIFTYYKRCKERNYENSDHMHSLQECNNYIASLVIDLKENGDRYLKESTLEYLQEQCAKVDEGIASMQPDVVYGEEDAAIPLLKKKAQLDFSTNFTKAFLDEDCEEVNVEAFNKMLEAGYRYDRLCDKEEDVLTEQQKFTRRVAIAADRAASKTARGMKRIGKEMHRTGVIVKKVPEHFDRMLNSTLDTIKNMDNEERRKRIIEGGFRFKLFKFIRNAILATGAAIMIHPAIAAVGIIGKIVIDKSLDNKVREGLIDELEQELRMTKEKISDASSNGDKKTKYQLMRLQFKLESELDRVRYRLNKIRVSPKGGVRL